MIPPTMTRRTPTVSAGSTVVLTLSAEGTDSAMPIEAETRQPQTPQPLPLLHPDEPNLYMIPTNLHPTYQSIPLLVNACRWAVAAMLSAYSTWRSHFVAAMATFPKLSPLLHPTAFMVALRNAFLAVGSSGPKQRQWLVQTLAFAVKTAILATLSRAILEDVCFAPSRIATGQLISDYTLPSPLSKYEPIKLELVTTAKNEIGDTINSTSIGVHWIQYNSRNSGNDTKTGSKYDAVYVNHGFGASCLSWLPALGPLVDRVHASTGIGHDMPGFGFTQRPRSTESYTTQASSEIGVRLLTERSKLGSSSSSSSSTKQRRVLLLGHSLGALTTLRMALRLQQVDPTLDKHIVLVAPALGFSRVKRERRHGKQQREANTDRGKTLFGRAKDRIFRYTLRRAVSTPGSWRKGLQIAWGDPQRVRDTDVLRFQWPSIGRGWEDGLLNFAQAQSRPELNTLPDRDLFRQVLGHPTTTALDVVVGDKDRVVPLKKINEFLKDAELDGHNVRVVVLEGLGHDPFEEDVDAFVDTVEKLCTQ